MAKRKMHGGKFCERLEVLGKMLAEVERDVDMMANRPPAMVGKTTIRAFLRRDKARADALTFALDVINDLLPTKVAYEAWGGKLLELSLNHSEDKDGRLLVYATLVDYTACEKPPHEDRVHVMRIDSATPLGTHEPRTADNALWLDMIAGMAECGVVGVVETVREPKALLTAGTEANRG